MTTDEFEGEIRFGVPHDIIYPHVPTVLRDISKAFPRVQVKLTTSSTRKLREQFARGELDVILTTEETPGEGGESLRERRLLWMGSAGGTAWKQRPLPIAFCSHCIFRTGTIRALDKAGIEWTQTIDSELDQVVGAAVGADLGVTVFIEGETAQMVEPIDHGGDLPDLGVTRINLYVQRPDGSVDAVLADMLRKAHRAQVPLPQLITV